MEVEINLIQPNNNPPSITEMTDNAALLDTSYTDTIKLKYTAEVGKEICYPITTKDEDIYNGISDYLSLQFISFKNEDNLKDRKSTRLNSSHVVISYAVFCLKKKKPT